MDKREFKRLYEKKYERIQNTLFSMGLAEILKNIQPKESFSKEPNYTYLVEVNQLNEWIKQTIHNLKESEENFYVEMLKEGRDAIIRKITKEKFPTPSLRYNSYIYRIHKLENQLQENMLENALLLEEI